MPSNPEEQARRRTAIVEILNEETPSTQADLVNALLNKGFHATQSSVSRDLRMLGVSKHGDGYKISGTNSGASLHQLEEAAVFVKSVTSAGPNLVVISTAIGAAQRVALALDRCSWPEIVGTISGDDTIFIAIGSGSLTRRLINRLSAILLGDFK